MKKRILSIILGALAMVALLPFAALAEDEIGTVAVEGTELITAEPAIMNFMPVKTYEECPKDSTCPLATFGDLDAAKWYHHGIHFCLENELMQGVSADSFNPGGKTTRAMVVTILWRIAGEPVVNYAMSFKDVAAGQWYGEAVRWAAASGVVKGYSEEVFAPDALVTREQLATMIYGYSQLTESFYGELEYPQDFADKETVSSWADEAVRWCCMNGILTGRDGNILAPRGDATRAETAAMIQRFCDCFFISVGGAYGESYLYYKVLPEDIATGDPLTHIANKLGVSEATLISLNNIKDPDLLYAGQSLKYPKK